MKDLGEEFMSVGAAAHELHLSANYVRRLVDTNCLPGCLRTPTGRLIPRDEVEKLRARRARKLGAAENE